VPAAATPRVLVVDDEENITYLVASALRLAGFEATTADTGTTALTAQERAPADVIVLDVMLPDVDGFEVLRRLRARGDHTPVVFLTARSDTADRVRGLTAGGDDYVVKPFALEELVARVQVALRRGIRGTDGAGGRGGTTDRRLRVHDLVLDEDQHRVWRGESEAFLTPTEYTLLRYLLVNAGRVVSRAQILDHVWNYDFAGGSAIVESFVSTLRKKVDAKPPRLIHTVRGVGYAVREPS